MREVQKLKKGDKIAFVSASSSVNSERVTLALEFFQSLGFIVEVKDSCKDKYGYLAGSDKVRAQDINDAFNDKEIHAVFCVRGGYGVPRMIDLVDFSMIKRNPKVFVGYSDVTALHVAINKLCDFITYHTPMATTEMYRLLDYDTTDSFFRNICVESFAREIMEKLFPNTVSLNLCENQNQIFTENRESIESKELIENRESIENPLLIENIPGYQLEVLNSGLGRGRLYGGNLSLIASMVGSKYELPKEGVILFIEDIEEEPYRVDRMLTQLKLSGHLDSLKGIILGEFTDCGAKYPERSLTLEEVFNDILKPLDIPILYNLKCGHCLPTISLPLGSMVEIDTEAKEIRIIKEERSV